jgi:hypothetical protein
VVAAGRSAGPSESVSTYLPSSSPRSPLLPSTALLCLMAPHPPRESG